MLPCETYGKNDGVAGLIGREALKIRVADGILNSGAEGKEEELNLEEDVNLKIGGKVASKRVCGWFH